MRKTNILLKNNWQFITLSVLTLFIVWPLFISGYFSHHDDLQVMRIFINAWQKPLVKANAPSTMKKNTASALKDTAK